MTIAILTTATPHHAYFVREVARAFPDVHVLDEQRRARFPFATHHPFEDDRDVHELARWFAHVQPTFASITQTTVVQSVNDPDAIATLRRVQPDVVVSFGVGKISPVVIAAYAGRILNLHGGDPEHYRGLDSHLWSIYHRDFPALVTTLHHVHERFDAGAIILQASVPLGPHMPLAEVRAANTETCTALTLAAIDQYRRFGGFLARPQRTAGRYYSAMPADLKAVCVERFAEYTATLSEASRTDLASLKAPSTKHQASNNIKIPSTNIQT